MTDPARETALALAVELHLGARAVRLHRGVDAGVTIAAAETAIRYTAETFLAWLHGPTSIHLHAGAVRDQTSGLPTGTPATEGNLMQIHDNEQFDLTADTKDAKGFETADVLTWEADDADVVTLVVSDDTKTCTVVAGNPGSAVITVSDGTLSATEAVDVVTGDTALITLAEGPVTVQA